MNKAFLLPSFLLFSSAQLLSQAPYTEKQFGWRVEEDLQYGLDTNYAGIPTPLYLDLYKPVGDNNPQRPLLVYVHGGFMLTGCRKDFGIVEMAKEFAQRGYAVACVEYRKGWHKDDYVSAPFCALNLLGMDVRCLYPADSSEQIRAVYRGQQDVKSAIRWLKARTEQDSTCPRRVLVGGESAGAFVSMAAAFLDRPEEKPVSCHALPDAPNPDPNLLNCYVENCVSKNINPSGDALKRPDLGPVDGTQNLNGYDANVLGVISFYGGMPYEALSQDWLKGPDTPAVYLYHRTCDAVVPFNYGKPTVILSLYCNGGCTPWHYNNMNIYGNGAIAAGFQSSAKPPVFTTEFFNCQAFDPNIAFFECLGRFADNGAYHNIINIPARVDSITQFFSPIVTGENCFAVSSKEPAQEWRAQVSPNPFGQRLSLFLEKAPEEEVLIILVDVSGKIVWSDSRFLSAGGNVLFEQNHLPAGFYTLQLRCKTAAVAWKVIRQ